VADTGTGISSQFVEHVFDPFFTTKEPGQGSGLGLSTALGIVKTHGGLLNLQNTHGQGCVLEVYLPAALESAPPKDVPERATPAAGHGELVLVVDDEPNILEATQRTLIRAGYKVTTAANGVDALAIFARESSQVKAVLSDLVMPIMDGLSLIRVLKKLKPGLAVLVSTGGTTAALPKNSLGELNALGVNAVLVKPFTAEKLLESLQNALSPPTTSTAA
jgi:hypothetical protein